MSTAEERELAFRPKVAILEALAKAWATDDEEEAAREVADIIRNIDPVNGIGGLAWFLEAVLDDAAAMNLIALITQFERLVWRRITPRERELVAAAARIIRAICVEVLAPVGAGELIRYMLEETFERDDTDNRRVLGLAIGMLRKSVDPNHYKEYSQRCERALDMLLRTTDEELESMVRQANQLGAEILKELREEGGEEDDS